jgi:hypothetical protein
MIDRKRLAAEIKAGMESRNTRSAKAELIRNAYATELGHSWPPDHVDPPVFGNGLRWKAPPVYYYDSNGRRMTPTAKGFMIDCRGCGRRFDSVGLAYCTPECARKKRERDEAVTIATAAGHEVRKGRACEVCGKHIPRYTKTGKATSSSVRTCSRKCRKALRVTKPGFDRFDPSETPILRASIEAPKDTP